MWKERFLKGSCPQPQDLQGVYKIAVVGFFPKIHLILHQKKKFQKIDPDFDGCNLLLKREKSFGWFRLTTGPSIVFPNKEVLKIVYDNPKNPLLLRPLVDDCVQIEGGLYLGVAMYPLVKQVNISYFTMERLRAE